MKQLIEYTLEDGTVILIEAGGDSIGNVTRSARSGDMVDKASRKFEDVLKNIKPVARAVLSTLREISESPDEASVEFGVKLSAKAGMIIASADSEANFVFKLTWKRGSGK